jgi:hypothetical protein
MSEGRLNNWVRMSLLLGALAAGTVVTQLIPKYHEAARTVTYPTKATPVTNAGSHTTGVSNDVDERQITMVRTKS